MATEYHNPEAESTWLQSITTQKLNQHGYRISQPRSWSNMATEYHNPEAEATWLQSITTQKLNQHGYRVSQPRSWSNMATEYHNPEAQLTWLQSITTQKLSIHKTHRYKKNLKSYTLSRGDFYFIPGQSMCDFCWTKWHLDEFSSNPFDFLLSNFSTSAPYSFFCSWGLWTMGLRRTQFPRDTLRPHTWQ
jgi:hypothetical protein